MEIKGVIKKILDVQTGTGANGKDWQKQDILIEYGDQYPKTVAVTCFGKAVDTVEQLTEGMQLTAHVNPESREYNGRYFTNINAWKLEFTGGKNVGVKPSKPADIAELSDEELDSLPF